MSDLEMSCGISWGMSWGVIRNSVEVLRKSLEIIRNDVNDKFELKSKSDI